MASPLAETTSQPCQCGAELRPRSDAYLARSYGIHSRALKIFLALKLLQQNSPTSLATNPYARLATWTILNFSVTSQPANQQDNLHQLDLRRLAIASANQGAIANRERPPPPQSKISVQ
jgi:hypothetical protein